MMAEPITRIDNAPGLIFPAELEVLEALTCAAASLAALPVEAITDGFAVAGATPVLV